MSTGRGFVIAHDRFLGQYCRYLQSHFVPAFEMMLLLIVSTASFLPVLPRFLPFCLPVLYVSRILDN